MTGIIVTCNAGSVNNRLMAFDAVSFERKGQSMAHSSAENVQWLCSIGELGIVAMGHRVVHGGPDYTHPARITDDMVDKLHGYCSLAPLHQAHALELISKARKLYPDVVHYACFDNGFHHTIPDIQRRFALPCAYHNEGIKRYGFHGLSYEYTASVLVDRIGEKAKGRVIVAHLGGGASACAMRNLQSVDCTTGFSTLDGLMMGTRCGAIDPGVLLYLLMEKKMTAQDVSDLLYLRSGLKGVSGLSEDVRILLESPNLEAREAIELYCQSAAKHIAGMLPTLGGLDVLVFTGGVGEHAAPVRDKIVQRLRWAGDFPVIIIQADEEIIMAKAFASLSN